jgi:hypothetical protein
VIGLHSVIVTPPGGSPIDVSCLVDDVTIRQGRDDTGSQPEAASATVNVSCDSDVTPWPGTVDVGTRVEVTTSLAGVTHTRFAGTVSDLSLGWESAGEDTPDRVVAQLVAVGPLADLGRRTVGDVPWPQQLDGARVALILANAGVTLDPEFSDPGTVQILARDVDSQTALDLAQEVASDAGGVLWATTAGEIRYADAVHRRGLTPSLTLDACDVLVTPTWRRTTEGMVNAVSIGYGVAPDGGDVPRYVAERADSIARWGEFGLTSTTQLAAAADAEALGNLLLTQNHDPVWVLGSLPVAVADLPSVETATLLGLEMHDLIAITGLPSAGTVPTSTSLWVEGWTETLAWGVHDLELVVSGYCRTSPPPRWNDVNPSTTWDTAQGTWDDATCLGPLPNLGRWDDVPATLRWDQVPPETTWNTYTGGP